VPSITFGITNSITKLHLVGISTETFMTYSRKVSISHTVSYANRLEAKSDRISGSMWDEAAMKEFDVGAKPLK
jgi:hypothetical protein